MKYPSRPRASLRPSVRSSTPYLRPNSVVEEDEELDDDANAECKLDGSIDRSPRESGEGREGGSATFREQLSKFTIRERGSFAPA